MIERAAITYYGEPQQAVKCMEECAELIEAIGVTLNLPDEVVTYAREIKKICKECLFSCQPIVMIVSEEQRSHIIEESADVTLTNDQMKMIFGPTLIIEDAKLKRLAENMGMIAAVGERRWKK